MSDPGMSIVVCDWIPLILRACLEGVLVGARSEAAMLPVLAGVHGKTCAPEDGTETLGLGEEFQ